MRSAVRYLVPVFAIGLLGCEDDKGGSGAAIDAPVDLIGDRPTDTPPVQDQRPSTDCALVGCGSVLVFKVPGFIARFGAEARLIDVTACRGTACADARVQLMDNGSTTTPGDGGPAQVGASLSGDVLIVGFQPATVPSATPRQEQVRLRIVTSGGRGLVDFTTQAPVDVYCPGGLGCGVCEATFVDLDTADGGQPVDGNTHPGRGGVCQ